MYYVQSTKGRHSSHTRKGYQDSTRQTTGSHGAGCWGFPGGHLEYGETVADCAIRETYEETGLTITNTQAYWFTEDFFSKEQRHYITIFVHAQVQSGTLNVQEPDKCLCWEWCDREALPQPLFSPIEQLLATKGL